MTSTQMICFFLAHPDLNDFWRPFLKSMPQSFDEHPLVWAMESDGSLGCSLFSMLPPHTRQAVIHMKNERFQKDLRIMKHYEVPILYRSVSLVPELRPIEVSISLKPADDTEWARAWLNGRLQACVVCTPGVDADHRPRSEYQVYIPRC